MPNIRRTIATATATAGTLDLLSAFVFSAMNGHGPIRVLHSVASGPFGPGMMGGGIGPAALGLIVHYTLMTVMVSVFVLAATRLSLLVRHPVPAGIAYGFGLYLVMYWIVLPLRYPGAFPQTGLWQVGNALFSHLICVGLPIGLITARSLRKR